MLANMIWDNKYTFVGENSPRSKTDSINVRNSRGNWVQVRRPWGTAVQNTFRLGSASFYFYFFFPFNSCDRLKSVSWNRTHNNGSTVQLPQRIQNISRMMLDRRRTTERGDKHVPMPARVNTPGEEPDSAAENRRLTAWATARPPQSYVS
jgi:hypothetical protein